MTNHRVTLLAVTMALLCLAIFTGCRSAHTTSAILYIEQEQYQKAIDVIDEGLQYNPDDPEGYYYQGEAYSRMAQQSIDEDDYPGAKQAFHSAYLKYNQSRDMDPEKMTNRVVESLEINYKNTLREGQSYWREQHFEQAEGFFRLAFAALPDSLESIKSIASMKIQQAEASPPDTATMLREDALDLLDQVLADRPEAYRLQADKAYVLTQLNRTDEAQAIYDMLLVEHGDDTDLLLDVVGLYSKQQRYSEAGDLFLQVAAIYMDDTNSENDSKLKGLYSEAGYNYQLANDFPRALDAYGRANEQDDEDTQIMVMRQQLYLQYGQELMGQVPELMQTDPARSQEIEAQAKVILQRGVDVGNALANLAPNNADVFYYLASTQALLGDSAAYEENMARYSELNETP